MEALYSKPKGLTGIDLANLKLYQFRYYAVLQKYEQLVFSSANTFF
jgi:hypothetical protein